ncbi:MAG: flagellar hook-length control protein FliK [Treponema sp.]|nr:flagellar hook-length control protein FliK [Treponema sp.]
MVIQITPHTEQAPVSPAVSQAASPGKTDAEESHKLKSAQSKGNRIGVFAKILAGLSGKGPLHPTGTGDAAHAAAAPKVPLAGAAESGKKALIAGEKGKVRTQDAALTTAAEQLKAKKSPKEPHNELSEQEKSALLAVSRLTGQPDELKNPGKVQNKRGLGNFTADSTLSGDESIKTDGILAELAQGRGANSLEKQSAMANAAQSADELAAKTAKTAVDKAKNRSIAETGAQSSLIAGENLRTEAKKPAHQEGIGKAEELRKEKKRNATFEVRDFRTGTTTAETVSVRAGGELRVAGEAASKDIMLELRLPQQDTSAAKTTWEVKAGQAFEDILARELHQNFNNDIVRHASVALRDEGQGTIRLALKPESLGNVKIHLEMAENKITGRIVVETVEALRAFEREIASLEKAFQDSGFEGANLEMSLADHGGAEQQWQETEASQFLPDYYAASRYDAAFESMELPLTLDVYQQGTRAVNVFA